MVTYCIGDTGAKRRAFKSSAGVVVDNDEVLLSYTLNGKMFFVVGANPFEDFTVQEYLSYSKSLQRKRPLKPCELKFFLRQVGCRVPLNTMIRSLNRIELKQVMLAGKIDIDSRELFINIDGLKYRKAYAKLIRKFMNNLSKYSVHLAVSDTRFIPDDAEIIRYLKDGTTASVGITRTPCFSYSFKKSQRVLKGKGFNISRRQVREVVGLKIV